MRVKDIDILGDDTGGLPSRLLRLRDELAQPDVWRGDPAPHGLGLTLRELTLTPPGQPRWRAVNLTVTPGEFVAVLLPSLVDASLFTRLLAGLAAPAGGQVEHWSASGSTAPAARPATPESGLRVVFREPRLLPWLSVLDNVRLALGSGGSHAQAHQALDSVGLAAWAGRRGADLDAAQQAAAALARALAGAPRLLLLDDPCSPPTPLTAAQRQVWRTQLARLSAQAGCTTVLATTCAIEAAALAQRVVVLTRDGVALDERVSAPRVDPVPAPAPSVETPVPAGPSAPQRALLLRLRRAQAQPRG